MSLSGVRSDVAVGVDVGTTNLKVVAVEGSGRVVARAGRRTPRDATGVTTDAEHLFRLVEDLVLEVCGRDHRVLVAAVAGVGEDGVLVDADLRPLVPALAWSAPERRQVLDTLVDRLPPLDGLGVDTDAARTLVGWAWASARADRRQVHGWVALTDYVGVRWSGRPFLGDTLAARTAAWRVDTRTWCEERVTATLGSPGWLPPVLPAGTPVGPLVSRRLSRAGVLAPGATVVVGGHDHPVAGWGVRRCRPGAVLDSMGTAEVVVAQTLRTTPGRPPGFDTEPGILTAGTTVLRVEELARNIAWAARDARVGDALRRLVAGTGAEPCVGVGPCTEVGPCVGVGPCTEVEAGEPEDAFGSGWFVPGAAGGMPPRSLEGTPPAPVARARAVLGALAAAGGEAVSRTLDLLPGAPEVFAAGGWSRSPGWMQIKARVTGRQPLLLGEPEVTAVGAALLGAAAVDLRVDPSAALLPEG